MQGKSLLSWIIFIGLALTWGSSFILMKRGMDAFSSYQVAALRISSQVSVTVSGTSWESSNAVISGAACSVKARFW